MAKKKKTRKQKIRSDLRYLPIAKKADQPTLQPISDEIPEVKSESIFQYTATNSQKNKIQISSAKQPLSIDYRYIMHDLHKTVILTVILVASQLALYFFVTRSL